jgi:transcriptional regulator with GAF, ATPase, and Fis domain
VDDSHDADLEDRLRFERLIADLSAEFVNLDSNLIDGAIQNVQRRLVEALDLDRSTLFQFSEDGASLIFTHYWSRPDLPPPPLVPRPAELFPWSTAKVLAGDTISFSSIDELPEPDREQVARFGTKSSVVVPLMVSGRVIGAVAFGTMREERQWTPVVLNRLSLIGQVFANALARKRTETELRRVLAENAQLRERLADENVYLRREIKARHGSRQITGTSAAIQGVLQQLDQVAPSAATVLLMGETGRVKSSSRRPFTIEALAQFARWYE